MTAKEAVEQDDVLATFPEDCVMTLGDAIEIKEFSKLAEGGLDERVVLALYVMHEKQKGSESKWASFFDLLPVGGGAALCWPVEEGSKILQGTELLSEMKAQRLSFTNLWTSLVDGPLADKDRFKPEFFGAE